MVRAHSSNWTVDELAARAALALADYAGQSSGRVREVPDLRAIRYYTTLGLLDRPGAMRGRTALYGRKHLAQLVAIKRLQAQGQSLVEVQQHLAKMSEAALFDFARVPPEAEAELAPGASSDASASAEPARPAAFWRSVPAEIAEGAPALKEKAPAALASVSLDARAVLVVDPARPLEESDVEAIRAAAAPLLKLLHKRGLIRPPNPEES